MKFTYTKSAKDYIKKNKIKKIYISPRYPRGYSCGLNAIRLDIKTRPHAFISYLELYSDGVSTFYDPLLETFTKSSPDIIIGCFGFGSIKKLACQTEFSSLSLA